MRWRLEGTELFFKLNTSTKILKNDLKKFEYCKTFGTLAFVFRHQSGVNLRVPTRIPKTQEEGARQRDGETWFPNDGETLCFS